MTQAGEIVGAGMITSVGVGASKTAAAVRAGISRVRATSLRDRRGQRIRLALLPDDDLRARSGGDLAAGREARITALAAAALHEVAAEVLEIERIPLLLSLPEALPGRPAPDAQAFLPRLAAASGVRFDLAASRAITGGSAAGLALVGEALDRLAARAAPFVLVGGADSPLDPGWIDALDREDRLRAPGVLDGFTPGEGAAFLLVGPPGSARKARREPLARVAAVSTSAEPGHRYSAEPYRGEGLDAALRALFAAPDRAGPVQTVFAGLNGESFHVKEWGVAAVRHRDRLAEGFRLLHPADCLGDTGAASGAAMLALAAIGLQRGYLGPPCLVWCASELGARAAALVGAAAS